MHKTLSASLVLGLVGLAGCPDVTTDPGEGSSPSVEFDPGASIIPFPNNLVLDPTTGRVAVPQPKCETATSAAIRTGVLNKLDGFGTYESALQVTFTEALDPASLDKHVFLFQRAKGTTPNDPATAQSIEAVLIPGTTVRLGDDCKTPVVVTSLVIVAKAPLEPRATYTVALTKGIKTASGAEFGPSSTWALVDQATSPVSFDDAGHVTENHTPLDPREAEQLETLKGLSLLWRAHKPALDFLDKAGHARGELLVAWEFNTQSSYDALDPTVAGSPAANIAIGALLGTQSITGDCTADKTTGCINRAAPPYNQCTDPATPAGNVQCFLKIALGGGVYADGATACSKIGCVAVGDVLGAKLSSKQYQQETPNSLAGGVPVPGPWSDPSRPTMVKSELIDALILVPATGIPAAGTVVFGHGLTSSKTSAFAIAPQLASKGFSTVAIDFVAHDSRAVRISNDAAKGCADSGGRPPAPMDFPQCYAPFLSSDLAGTRDNIRQSVLDVQGLVASLKACGTDKCGALKVDPAHLVYMGLSLGGIIGATTAANVADFKGAVLNVGGVGWVDVFENTATMKIRCSLVDALIGAGVLTGAPSDAPDYTTGLCTTEDWKRQPGYKQFSVIARWVLDPADGANFTRKLASRKILIQEVVNDAVVPNIATEREAALVGLLAAAAPADPQASLTPKPSGAITTNATSNKFLRYANIAPGNVDATGGNTFQHSSLLAPAATVVTPPVVCTPQDLTGCDGVLGTLRMQTDAITFLVANH